MPVKQNAEEASTIPIPSFLHLPHFSLIRVRMISALTNTADSEIC